MARPVLNVSAVFPGTFKLCFLFGLVVCFAFYCFPWKPALLSKMGQSFPFEKEKGNWVPSVDAAAVILPREKPLVPSVLTDLGGWQGGGEQSS